MNLRLAVCYVIFAAVLSVMAIPQSPAFARQSSRKVNIIIEQEYGGESLEILKLEILKKEDVALWFRYAGVEIVDDENAGGTIKVTIKAEALRAFYDGSGFCYTGASITGNITFVNTDGTSNASFSGKVDPPKTDTAGSYIYMYPRNAPFREAIIMPFFQEMALLIGSAYGIEPLIAALKDENFKVRVAAVEALGKIGDPRTLEPLISALKDPSVDWAAVEALGKIDPGWRQNNTAKRVISEFIVALRDKNDMVRQNAAKTLGETGDPRAVEPLIAALKDGLVYIDAARALEKIDPEWRQSDTAKRMVPEFIAALKDTPLEVRKYAANVLGTMGDPQAVQPLIVTLKDTDLGVRLAASEALRKITGQFLGTDAVKWQEWWDTQKEKE